MITFLFKPLLRVLAIIAIKYLQRRYKVISLKNLHRNTTQTITKLQLIQAVLFYFKRQFQAWGYFHPLCLWSNTDEKKFRKLFPQKDFREIDLVVWYNPEAVTYYQNKIFHLSKGATPCYEFEIRKQLIKNKDWN